MSNDKLDEIEKQLKALVNLKICEIVEPYVKEEMIIFRDKNNGKEMDSNTKNSRIAYYMNVFIQIAYADLSDLQKDDNVQYNDIWGSSE